MSSPPDCQALPEGYQLEGYRIDRMLSRGGFSIAYMASKSDGTPIVIKEYLPMHLAQRAPGNQSLQVSVEGQGKFNSGMRSFLEEAKLLAHIRHPNIVAVLDFAKANNTAYIMMKYEQGHSLEEHVFRLKEHGKTIRESFLREVFVHLLSGLREVHSRKLLHLDLKPANIYLGEDRRPVLLDFGAARWGVGQSEGVLGNIYTRGFAAPEQQGSGESLGPWTDIYAIGATLYACLDRGKTPQSADLRMTGDELEPARRRWAKVYSLQLLELIDWCMQLSVRARPQSVYALQKVLNGELLDLVDPAWFQK
ncbi:serine/threonine-protein kinase [Propionivibrio sp.]|uniref:serine/threonine protein kinase n=1 Tax=Propionivibrio sp. TaxID=2212460 RepID=UPI0025D6CB9A|nr:serine/threonine-protein kinase [Propionivibrio sp.]MBK7356555.1 serine/threonine protein kinase [Propionivibrio sp.]MBK8400969.1 serine/threonine protein kinase [Propionivibrio sp.]MBK8744140.1 serine/threonine protein kinase [Propionivibrio sp.]MBK8894254.1 serine/threonine protein kinase [Propionivibrio sp.]MBL0207621.1 serine/threonine protein kinase [Propionivibrio sp.]